MSISDLYQYADVLVDDFPLIKETYSISERLKHRQDDPRETISRKYIYGLSITSEDHEETICYER